MPTDLALSLYRLAAPTPTGRAVADRLASLLGTLGIAVHRDTAPAVLDHGGQRPAPGAHLLAHGDLAVIFWPVDAAANGLPMNAADVMLDALQETIEEIGVYPGRDGTPRYQTDRPETCEVEALIVWDAP